MDFSLGRAANLPRPALGFEITCHVAVLCWALEELDLNANRIPPVSDDLVRLLQHSVPEGVQNVMLNLPRSGTWSFRARGTRLPPIGTVLVWDQLPTHSAIVTRNGVTGYNQVRVFPGIRSRGYTHASGSQVDRRYDRCHTVSAADLLAEADVILKRPLP